MARSTTGDQRESPPVAPAAVESSRSNRWAHIKVQFRTMVGLRAMWADLRAQPVPTHLLHLIREFESRQRRSDDGW